MGPFAHLYISGVRAAPKAPIDMAQTFHSQEVVKEKRRRGFFFRAKKNWRKKQNAPENPSPDVCPLLKFQCT